MFNNTLLFVEVFIFIFCSLNVVKTLYKCIKVLVQKEGKVENDTLSTILFGCSLSYIIATLIIGF